jgi:hypothetical protein
VNPVIVFPDAEQIIREAIATATGEQWFVRPPASLPEGRFGTVRRIGGRSDSLVTDTARLRFTCWGVDDPDALTFAQEARARLLALYGTVLSSVPIYSVVEVGGPVPFTDNERPTYFFTHDIRLRGDTT